MLGDGLLQRAKRRLTQPAFAAVAARLRAELKDDLQRPAIVPPPDQPAGYYHDYFCPHHGVQLEFSWDSPRVHRCPVDGTLFRGQPYDRSWWWFVNHTHSEAAFRLALGWRLLDDTAYLAKLRANLMAYSAHYPEAGWPKDDPRGRQGKVAYHALDEAVWLIPLAWAYEVVRDALPEAARLDVEQRLLQPAAEHLLAQRWLQVHNYMCWLNAAVATVATLLRRDDLLSAVIDGPYGANQQVAEGVLADGTWWEGSASYHYYTLAALLATVRATNSPVLRESARRMFLAPLRWAYPDLSLPAINDCWYHSSLIGEVGHGIPPAAAFYEVAAGWYRDPAFRTILLASYAAGGQRDSIEALLFGPDDVTPARTPPAPRLLTASADLAQMGFAVLRGPTSVRRAGPDHRIFALLKYGRHGGGHGHPDKLGLVLAGCGESLSPDLGTPGYGIGLNNSWYRNTLSHNTVMIDSQPQPAATGRLLRFIAPRWWARGVDRQRFGLMEAAVSWPADAHDVLLGTSRPSARTAVAAPSAYDGVSMRRLLLLRPEYLIDVFFVTCPAVRQVDWLYHNRGQLTRIDESGGSGLAAVTADDDLPEPLLVEHTLRGNSDVVAGFRTGSASLRLWLAGVTAGGARVYAARAPANPASETMAMIVRRCSVQDVMFVSLFHPHLERPAVQAVSWRREGDRLRCHVALRRGAETWDIPLRAGQPSPVLSLK